MQFQEYAQCCVKADRHEATLPRNYYMQPCYATYAMSNHDVQRLHGNRYTPRLRGKVALSALRMASIDHLHEEIEVYPVEDHLSLI